MANRILPLVVLLVSVGFCSDACADDSDTRTKINTLQKTVADLEQRIATLEASLDEPDEPKSFEWDVMGTRLRECDPSVIEALNDANKTRYRGAVTVTDVRPHSAAATAGIKGGDLLLGINRWQTTDLHDLKLIARKHNQLAAMGKTKFFVVRNGQTLFGYIDLPQP